MRMKSGVVTGFSRLPRIRELSREASKRLKWFDYFNSHGRNARLTCRYFGISLQTFYRWKRCYDPKHLESLEDRSHKPKRLRPNLPGAMSWLNKCSDSEKNTLDGIDKLLRKTYNSGCC